MRDNMVAIIFSDDMRTEAGRTLERQIRAAGARCQCDLCGSSRRHCDDRQYIESRGQRALGDRRRVRSPSAGESDERCKRCDQLSGPVGCEWRLIAENPGSRGGENRCARHGKSVSGARTSRSPKLSLRIFQCDGFGNQRSESIVRRDCDPGTSSGQHPEHRAARRWHRASRTNRARRFSTWVFAKQLNAAFRSQWCLAAFAFLPACSVNVKDHDDDGNSKVDINTPVGRNPR